jgi:hypothetical protein
MTDATRYPAFRSIPRLNREVVVTEKIDGSNGLIDIRREFFGPSEWNEQPGVTVLLDMSELDEGGVPRWQWEVRAGSRKRWISLEQDNFGFAQWVRANAETLALELGEGLHYGEWWGSGIQRGYGLPKGERRFSLFNCKRWGEAEFTTPGLDVVPALVCGNGRNLNKLVELAEQTLLKFGSVAAPGFYEAEGIVLYHTQGNLLFKVTLENDAIQKSFAPKEDKQ